MKEILLTLYIQVIYLTACALTMWLARIADRRIRTKHLLANFKQFLEGMTPEHALKRFPEGVTSEGIQSWTEDWTFNGRRHRRKVEGIMLGMVAAKLANVDGETEA